MKSIKFKALPVLLAVIVIQLVLLVVAKKEAQKEHHQLLDGRLMTKKVDFSTIEKFKQQETPPGMVPVEGGTFTMGKVQDDVMHDWNNSPNQQHVQSFYMDETEVTNFMYTEYLILGKESFSSNRRKLQKYL